MSAARRVRKPVKGERAPRGIRHTGIIHQSIEEFEMRSIEKKKSLRQKRIWRIRKKLSGTAQRPRLCVTFSNKNIYAQLIDDAAGKTLVGVGSLAKDFKEVKLTANKESAQQLGKAVAEKAKSAGIESVIFDRHGRPYHGRVKVFAEAAREAGLKF
jgi:large subunit ribosomal protein L18